MQRAKHLVGKTIVTADGGERVGSAADLLVSPAANRVVGIVVRDGVLSGERVLPYDDVQSIGPDAIVARSGEHVMDPKAWHARGDEQAVRASSLKDRRVVTRDGREVGAVADVCLDERTGQVEGYDVTRRGFGGLVSRHRLLRSSGEVTVGPDAVLVSSEAAGQLEARRDERKRR